MALNRKGKFGPNLEEHFKDVPSVNQVEAVQVDAHTQAPTYTYTHTLTPAPKKETLNKRLAINVTPSTRQKLEEYSIVTGKSMNIIVNEALGEFFEKNGW